MAKDRQHFVPQLLLRRFAAESGRKSRKSYQVWVRDLSDNRVYRTNIRNVAAPNFFYDYVTFSGDQDSADPWIRRLEDLTGPAISKLVRSADTHALSQEEREVVAAFVACQSTRGIATRFDLEILPEKLREALSRGGPIGEEVEELLSPDDPNDAKASHAGAMVEIVRESYLAISKRPWLLHRPCSGKRFCTSDNPVLRYNELDSGPRGNTGLLCTGVVLCLALSSDLALTIVEPSHYNIKEGGMGVLTQENLDHYESLLTIFAHKEIYALRDTDLEIPADAWRPGPKFEIASP